MSQTETTWSARLARYKGPDLSRSVWQLASAAVLFAAAWALMYVSLGVGYWLTLLLAVPTCFFLVRLFIIQHDCGHGSFFRSTRAADLVGSVLGVLTLTPYHYWKKTHALHHATSGNLEHRGFGDIDTLTVDEYLALSRWGQFKYRVYRHPVVLFGIGAILHFFVRHRIPTIVPREWTRERRSILWTDVGLVAGIVLMGTLVGFRSLVLVQLPVTLLTCMIGVWLFYVQHQFEPTYWEHDDRWAYDAAALQGSSYYRLPRLLGSWCRLKQCGASPPDPLSTSWRGGTRLRVSLRLKTPGSYGLSGVVFFRPPLAPVAQGGPRPRESVMRLTGRNAHMCNSCPTAPRGGAPQSVVAARHATRHQVCTERET